MRIQHNIMAMSAYRNYTNNVSAMKKNLEKLSSGYKINRAGDDAAGLAISEKMRAQITGLETAQKNAKDGISLVQTAEGALTEVHDMLNRMVELATQSANGTYDDGQDRKQLQKEVDQLLSEIDRIADSSNFNGIKLLDGSLGLNSSAVTDVEYLDAAGAVAPKDVAGAASVTNPHGANAASYSKPSATIDLGDVEIHATSSTGNKANIKINIGSVELALASVAITPAGGKVTASAIATALTTKYTGNNGSAATKAIAIGDGLYKVTGTKSALTLEYVGIASQGKIVADTATGAKFTTSMANDFKTAINPGATVTVTASNGGKVVNENSYIHGVTAYNPASAKGESHRFGADIDLVASKVMVDGNTINIDGKTFQIALSSTANSGITNAAASTGTSVVTINTTKNASAAAQLKELVKQMEGANAGRFKVSGKTASKMHFDVRSTVAASKVASLSTGALAGLVSVKDKGAEAVNNRVEFKVDDTKFVKGDVVKVGNKSFVYQGTGTNSFASAADLKSKLETAFNASNVSTVATNGKIKFTVSASNATKAAPMLQGRGLTLQIGDTAEKFNQLNVGVQDMHAVSLGIRNLSIANEVDAQNAIAKIKDAINTVSDVRGTLGATQNRLDHTINNLSVMTENIQDAESTIRDVDVAEEMMAYTKNNILIQSAQAMLAQANQVPQGVLQLLQ